MGNPVRRNKAEPGAFDRFLFVPHCLSVPECPASEQDVSFNGWPIRGEVVRPAPLPVKMSFRPSKYLARKVLSTAAMSSLENIYKKMAEAAAVSDAPQETTPPSPPHVSPAVAHELNNIIAIIRGYADRLLFKHGDNPAIEPQLKLISEAAKRAAIIIHDALPRNPGPTVRQNPPPAQPTTP
jgi:hypothetical protein